MGLQNVLGVCDHCRAHGPYSCHSEIHELPWLPGYRSRGGGELWGEVGREEAAPKLYQVDFRRVEMPEAFHFYQHTGFPQLHSMVAYVGWGGAPSAFCQH